MLRWRHAWGLALLLFLTALPPASHLRAQGAITITAITVSPACPVSTGTPVTWTTTATGGTPPCSTRSGYATRQPARGACCRNTPGQRRELDSRDQWHLLRAGVGAVGGLDRQLRGVAQQRGLRRDRACRTGDHVRDGGPSSPVAVGTAVTWTATATGGTAPLHYKVWLRNDTAGTWSVLQEYAATNQVAWTPTAAATYYVQVWVRSAGRPPSMRRGATATRMSSMPVCRQARRRVSASPPAAPRPTDPARRARSAQTGGTWRSRRRSTWYLATPTEHSTCS